MTEPDFPRVSGARTDPRRIVLDLGQVETELEWQLPDGVGSGSVASTTSVHNGESYDPPIQSVHVYPDMRFEDRRKGRTLTVEGFRFHQFDAEDAFSYEWVVDFAEDPPEEADPADLRFGVTATRFARYLIDGRLVLQTDEDENADEADATEAASRQ